MIDSPTKTIDKTAICSLAKQVITTEAEAVHTLAQRIDEKFVHACEVIHRCEGHVIVIGMGKSGHVGSKIAATFASTGSPSFFMHPGEACHGDTGMMTKRDVVLAISNSGETDELITLLPAIKHLKIPLITLTGNLKSTLAQAATVNLNINVSQEACPLGLAPTSSTTAALVMGDALAIALFQLHGLTKEDFARFHPGGNLGQRLLLTAADMMYHEESVPKVKPETKLYEALIVMTEKSLGMLTIADENDQLLGIYTDGDVRRTLTQSFDIKRTTISEVMTKNPITITPDTLAVSALQIMERRKITSLIVTDGQQKILGVVHIHRLLESGLSTLGAEN